MVTCHKRWIISVVLRQFIKTIVCVRDSSVDNSAILRRGSKICDRYLGLRCLRNIVWIAYGLLVFYTGYGICMAYLDSHRTEYRRRAGGVYEVLALINAIEVCIVGSFTKGKSITYFIVR